MSLINYIKETRVELRHVNWLTRDQLIEFTVLVIVMSLAAGFYLGFFDALYTYLLNLIISSR